MKLFQPHGQLVKGRGHPCPRVPGREALETRGQGCPRPFREVHELALLQSARDHFLIALLIASLGSAFAARAESFDLPSKESPAATWWRDSMNTRDERIEWWREARFGMFVHWGVYSSLGNEYNGRKGGG